MKICVLVKEVPDAAVEKKIDPSTGRMDRSGEKNLNPYDTHAIEAAMQIKEGGAVPVEEIVAVTMGPESAVRALHKAVSLGADRSVHLSDEAVAGSDVAATGYALAKTLQRESPDLVLLGQQSDDGECYTIGAVVAEHLGMPSLTQVIKMDVESEALRCERQAEYGYDTVQIKLPAVISVGDAINEPRYPSLKAIMGAKKKPLDTRQRGRRRDRREQGRRRELGRTVGRREGAAEQGGRRDHRGRGHRRDGREDRRLARREEADLDGKHPRLRAALRRRDQQELARRRLRGRQARCRARRRGARDPARRERAAGPGGDARQIRRQEGARRRGSRGARAAAGRRDGRGDLRWRLLLRAVRRRPARLRDRRRSCRASRRRRGDGGHERARRGRRADRRAADPRRLGDLGDQIPLGRRHHHRAPERVRDQAER